MMRDAGLKLPLNVAATSTSGPAAAIAVTMHHSLASIASFHRSAPLAGSSATTTAPGDPRSAMSAALPVPASVATTCCSVRAIGPTRPAIGVSHAIVDPRHATIVERSAPEVPVVEAPVVDAPVVDAPVVDAPPFDAPAFDAPAMAT